MENIQSVNWTVVVLAALWTLPWKGWALWRAAERKQLTWFVVFLLVNTLGLLEIAYIFWFSKLGKNK